uniref:DUF4379 domain-containing protein n=1 Tax=Ascaris lumbricoides TaxID=6252 RepID=A0A0M3HNV7_ASCLU
MSSLIAHGWDEFNLAQCVDPENGQLSCKWWGVVDGRSTTLVDERQNRRSDTKREQHAMYVCCDEES